MMFGQKICIQRKFIRSERFMPSMDRVIELPIGRPVVAYDLEILSTDPRELWAGDSILEDIRFRAWKGPELAIDQEHATLDRLLEHNRQFGLPEGNRLFMALDGSALESTEFHRLSLIVKANCMLTLRVFELSYGR